MDLDKSPSEKKNDTEKEEEDGEKNSRDHKKEEHTSRRSREREPRTSRRQHSSPPERRHIPKGIKRKRSTSPSDRPRSNRTSGEHNEKPERHERMDRYTSYDRYEDTNRHNYHDHDRHYRHDDYYRRRGSHTSFSGFSRQHVKSHSNPVTVPKEVKEFHHKVMRETKVKSVILKTPDTAKQYNFKWPDGKSNIHLQYAYERNIYGGESPNKTEEKFSIKNRILAPDSPKEVYRSRANDGKSVLHWGQRKLLLSEVEFLTLFGHLAKHVVYAGASPGTHITTLCEMFPDHLWYLYDPNEFDQKLYSPHYKDKIKIFKEYFLLETAIHYSKIDCLFISDIRTANPKKMTESEIEERVKQDNEWMKEWVLAMKPKKAMLKWRLPYKPGKTLFLQGDAFLGVWSPQTSTETRLITSADQPIIEYDHTQYEQQMFYFNTVTRLMYYPHNIEGDGFDSCYDCMSEIWILSQYLEKTKKVEEKSLGKEISLLSFKISQELGSLLSKYVHRVYDRINDD